MAQKKTTNKAEKEAKEKVKAAPIVKKTSDDIQLDAALYIGESLTKVEKGTNWYKRFIDALMDDAIKNPNGRCGQLLASTLFNETTLSKLGTEASKAKDDQEEYRIYQLRQTLYKEQQEVFDNQIDRNIIVICSRRAGKTELNARKLLKTALRRNSPCLYLNKTFANAIDQMYDLVMDLAGKLDFAIASSSKTDGMIKFTNGSSIKFGGINDIAAIDKYRGFKFRLVIVDEVGHIKNGQYLIDEVLEPATSDFTDSQMLFTGTPPRVKNFATRLWHSKIRKYHWTAIDNPFIHDFQEFIDKKCKEKGLTIDDPFIQREYYGNMDAYDTNAIIWKGYKVYKLSDILSNKVEVDANQLGHIIFHPTSAYIGVDWGGTDNNAIVSVLVDEIGKHAFVYDLWVDKKTGLEVIKAEIQKAYNNAISRLQEYGIDDSGKRVHIITDTNMVEFCVDLCNLGLPVEKAMKYEMMTSVEDMGALMRTGKVLIPDNWTEDDNMLIKDLKNTVYKRDEETDDLMPVIDDDSYHPDAAHALRYAIRAFTISGTWLSAKATNIAQTDPTIIPGQENLKEYGPKGARLLDQGDSVVEEFIL
jgi:superfamily II DNA or RNA helicase